MTNPITTQPPNRARTLAALGTALLLCATAAAGQAHEWPYYGGDPGAMRYSPVTTIHRGNVRELRLAWTWNTGETALRTAGGGLLVPGRFEATPVMVGDTLFLSTPLHRVVALDATTGRELWSYDPGAFRQRPEPRGARTVHRGVALGTVDGRRRVFFNTRWRLLALSAATGQPVPSFGRRGEVDLAAHAASPAERALYGSTSPPVVFENLVIVGASFPDEPLYAETPGGHVQAFDLRTGRRIWSFDPGAPAPHIRARHRTGTAPQRVGGVNVWAPMTVDLRRGLLFLPVGGPWNDAYGGDRPGDNLYANSIVCLDARTGTVRWHFQTVHHPLWDYDIAAPPLLYPSRAGGRATDAVAVLTKTGFVFAFERATGRPIWPIEERPVPPSDVPGERAAPTQPFPTRPAPFAKQGFSLDDVIDFTPELRALALERLRGYRAGPLYTPPSLQGTIAMPGWVGGAAWGGGAFDPETGTLYVKATEAPSLVRLVRPATLGSALRAPFVVDHREYALELLTLRPLTLRQRIATWLGRRVQRDTLRLPINKPPYGTLTAIDMTTGEHRWRIVLGDEPAVREHPALRKLRIPPTGVRGMAGPTVTRGGLVFVTGGGSTLYALDKDTGATLWQAELGARAQSNPGVYQTRDGRPFVVVAVGERAGARLMAFSLPWR